MTKQLVASALMFLLVYQLQTISVSVGVPAYVFGQTVARVVESHSKPSTPYKQAVYAAEQKESYESLLFVGDVMLARNVEHLMNTKSLSYPFEGLKLTEFVPQPAIVGNFEAAIAPVHEMTPVGDLTFSVPTTSIASLRAAGFTHLSLGNNHSFDYGREGFEYTNTVLSQQSLTAAGSEYVIDDSSVSYLNVQQERIALLNVNLLNASMLEPALTVLTKAAKKSSVQIVYVHWGEEYDLYNSSTQHEMAHKLVEAGADIIIGHHPHVVQGVDFIEGVPVFYSLGNYIFDQYFSRDVQEGLAVTLQFGAATTLNLLPVSSVQVRSQPRLMEADEHREFLTTLARKSHPALQSMIESGKITITDSVASSSKMAMMVQ